MAEDYAREVAKVAVAQIADLAGYEQTHRNALEAVADVLIRYIREIGLYAKEYAELQKRTDVAAPDVVEAVGDMGHTCSDLYSYLTSEPRDPFAHVLPEFPVHARAVQPPSFKASGTKPPAHIPDHLPAFPDQHTMKFSALLRKRTAGVKQEHIELSRKRKQAETALIQLHQKRTAASSASAKVNPFLPGQPLREAEPLSLEPPAAGTAGGAGTVHKVFEGLLQQANDAAENREHDTDMADAEDLDAENRGSWQVITPSTDSLEADSVFKLGRIGFSMDMASQLEKLAMNSRNAWRVEDAFERGTQVAEPAAGGRRRTSIFDSDKLRKKRAMAILDSGPDAIDMDERHIDDDDAY